MKTKRINNLLDYILLILTVLSSKTVYFGLVYAKVTAILFTAVCLLMFIYRCHGKVRKNLISTFVIFIIFAIALISMHVEGLNSLFFNTWIVTFVPFGQMFCVACAVDKKSYITKYVNVLFVMSVISLICFSLVILKPEVIGNLYNKVEFNNSIYNISPYYTWGWGIHIFERNSGMFWEPGAFQGFLIIAILFIIFFPKEHRYAKIKTIVFLITVLSTGSTTGYELLILMSIAFYKKFILIFSGIKSNKEQRTIIFVAVSCLIIAIVCYIVYSGNISDKLSSDNISGTKRLNDFLNSWIMVFDKPLFGYSFTSARITREVALGVDKNSVGFTSLLYTCGIPFGICYCYAICRGIKSFFEAKTKDYIVLLMIFLIIYFTEAVWWLPVYVMFLYLFKGNRSHNISTKNS